MRRVRLPIFLLRRATIALAIVMTTPLFTDASAADRARQREIFRRALDSVERGGDWKPFAIDLDGYPLLPSLEASALARQLDKVKREDVADFLARWPDTLAARDLREAYLLELARRAQWTDYLAVYEPTRNRELQCHALRARTSANQAIDFATDLKPLWDADATIPTACAGPMQVARDSGAIDDALVWQRIERAVALGQSAWIDPLVGWLPKREQAVAQRFALAARDPASAVAQASAWPDDARHRLAAATSLARLARRASTVAEAAAAKLDKHFSFSTKQKGDIAAALALYRATEFDAGAAARLASVPAEAQTDATREWRVRVSLAASDWAGALEALDALGESQRADAEWRYLRARVLAKLDRRAEAEAVFAELAREATFYGFLAADWIGQPYAICPSTLAADPAAEHALLVEGGLARAFEWRALDRPREARAEWDYTLARLDAPRRRLAADLAYREGWYDRAVFALASGPELKLYEQRFPLAREQRVKRESHSSGLDPAWTYAIIRAESAWVEDARSGANALGLMQLLPATAERVAKLEKIPYARSEDLFKPDTNIALGTRYLSRMAGRYDGAPWLASAAYNAGPGAVERWLGARGDLEPDFFIASIPYRETREYVARVLAFSVIYDWRMHGRALTLASRLPRYGQAYVVPDDRTARKAVSCPVAVAEAATPAASPATGVTPPTQAAATGTTSTATSR